MLRRDHLCPGPGECPEVLMRDPFADASAPPCDECPLALLDEYLATPAGRWIGQTIDLDFALQAGVTVSLKDISYPEFLLLRFLSEERNRFHEEAADRARNGR
jgi:hypothetical protein